MHWMKYSKQIYSFGSMTDLSACASFVYCTQDAPVVVAANDAGGLLVFRLVNIAADKLEPAELQHTRLEEALRANVMGALVTASS